MMPVNANLSPATTITLCFFSDLKHIESASSLFSFPSNSRTMTSYYHRGSPSSTTTSDAVLFCNDASTADVSLSSPCQFSPSAATTSSERDLLRICPDLLQICPDLQCVKSAATVATPSLLAEFQKPPFHGSAFASAEVLFHVPFHTPETISYGLMVRVAKIGANLLHLARVAMLDCSQHKKSDVSRAKAELDMEKDHYRMNSLDPVIAAESLALTLQLSHNTKDSKELLERFVVP